MRGNSGSFSSSTKNLITPLCGTLHYAAPEVLEIEDELPQYNQVKIHNVLFLIKNVHF